MPERRKELLEKAQRVIELARRRCVTFCDIRVVEGGGKALLVQDGRIEKAGSGWSSGAGIRVLERGPWGLASTDVLTARSLERTLEVAIQLAHSGAGRTGRTVGDIASAAGEPCRNESVPAQPDPVPIAHCASRLLELERAGRSAIGNKIVNSIVSGSWSAGTAVVANTCGTLVLQCVPRASISCTMIAADSSKHGVFQRWSERKAGRKGPALFDEVVAKEFTVAAARKAVQLLSARTPPAGEMPVVFDASIAGLLVHESLGHNAEADLLLSGQSILEHQFGKTIGSEKVTIVDDPTIEDEFGSYVFDAEGVPAQRVEIVKNGTLVGLLHSLETAAAMRTLSNGHGRSEGYTGRPLPRMSNTFFAPGSDSFDSMISGISRGVLLTHGSGGYVLTERGQYTCRADEGRLIEHGKLTDRLRNVSISGMILDTLRDVEGVGPDFRLDDPGFCSKNGQEVPVCDGGPHLMVKKVVVGGR